MDTPVATLTTTEEITTKNRKKLVKEKVKLLTDFGLFLGKNRIAEKKFAIGLLNTAVTLRQLDMFANELIRNSLANSVWN